MNQKLKESMVIDRLVGEQVTQTILNDLLTEGRISFPFKPTTTSAISTPEDIQEDDNIQTYLDSVADNEELVKMLEDMRDDMLKDMNIPPANDTISNAAKVLGSPDGTITKDIFDKAEVILDPHVFIPNQLGIAPHIGALTGDGILKGDFIDCHEVSKAIADNWKLTGSDQSSNITVDELHKKNAQKTIQKTKDAFNKKLKDMFRYIFRMLWWNELWPRIVNFHLDMLEKLIARPTDAPFLILRFFKKLTRKNFYKYGPIHKLINKLRIFLLCSVPRRAWKDYSPGEDIQVWVDPNFMALKDYCSRVPNVNACPESYQEPTSWKSDDEGDVSGFPFGQEKAKDLQNKIKDEISIAFPTLDPNCIPSALDGLFKEKDIEGPGLSPKCMEAAKVILDAVYDDAMSFTEYEGSEKDAQESFKHILEGSIKDAQEAQREKK